ncbi:MAG: DUF4443 domain-containing protein [Nitrososphaera sp.]|jgi:predicted transcriptional regulator
MHNVVKLLDRVSQRYYPSRMLTFEPAHIFKVLQLLDTNAKTSRATLILKLGLGEGSIKTLVKHLKMENLISTTNAGMTLTSKGTALYSKIKAAIPAETEIDQSYISFGRANHAVLVRGISDEVGSGILQRDAAIKMGALGASTIVFQDGRLFTSDNRHGSPISDSALTGTLIERMHPQDGDVIIIASANDPKVADLAAKRAALETVSAHEKHVVH